MRLLAASGRLVSKTPRFLITADTATSQASHLEHLEHMTLLWVRMVHLYRPSAHLGVA